jgi:hypothetical protein
MPPFRIVARHPDRGHNDHTWAQIGATHDSLEDVEAVLKASRSADRPGPRSLPLGERVVSDPLVDRAEAGYETKVQELAPSKTEDVNGFPVDLEHTWKDVK